MIIVRRRRWPTTVASWSLFAAGWGAGAGGLYAALCGVDCVAVTLVAVQLLWLLGIGIVVAPSVRAAELRLAWVVPGVANLLCFLWVATAVWVDLV